MALVIDSRYILAFSFLFPNFSFSAPCLKAVASDVDLGRRTVGVQLRPNLILPAHIHPLCLALLSDQHSDGSSPHSLQWTSSRDPAEQERVRRVGLSPVGSGSLSRFGKSDFRYRQQDRTD